MPHRGGDGPLRLQAGLGNLEPGHHVSGQTFHVHHGGEEPGVLDLSVPAGQEAEIGPHAYGEQADALPPAFGVVQNGGQLPDADRGLAEGGPARAVPVFRQVEAQDLTAGERLRQKAKGHVCLAGLGPVDGDNDPL